MEDGELFINLASNEYFKAVDTKKLKVQVITPVFKHFKNGKLKVIKKFYGKKSPWRHGKIYYRQKCKSLKILRVLNYMVTV